MRTITFSLLAASIMFVLNISGQTSKEIQKATLIKPAEKFNTMPSIAEQILSGEFIPAEEITKEVNPRRSDANKAVPGKGFPVGNDPLWKVQAKASKIKSPGPILTFEAASSGVTPTDPTGAVGPDHYVNSWNSSFRIWDKEGNALTSPASLGTIWPGQTLGDPIVIYDQIADRFLITQFYGNGFLIAVSQDSDPVNSGWYTYQFATNTFPDYPKFTMWSDGYYITANKNSNSAGTSEVVFALEREKMLEGDPDALMIGFPLPGITTSGFFSPLGFNVNGQEMPPSGNAPIVYMQDDVWSGVSDDHLKIWTINVDWETPENSTISDPLELETEDFDGLFDGGNFSNLPQPSGSDLDALQATIMYMAQYRRFSGHNSVVFNFVVDLDGNDDYSGIRWYELRQESDEDPWEIYQEGTYSQPEGHSAYAGTMCMDANGNIALAYSVVSTSQYPSLRYTGRFATDPLGEMTVEEESFAEGTMSDPSFRYGDYSQMTIDPVDDLTFWSIAEYFTGGTRKNQVGVFKIAPDLANDVGVISVESPLNGVLTDAEPITVNIRNFGIDPQTEIPVSYQVNGGDVVTETFIGSIPANSNELFTFTTLADFSEAGATYEVLAFTSLDVDENSVNDTIVAWIDHLHPNDMGISQILSPVSGSELSTAEPITVVIENYGANLQSDFEVAYKINSADAVVEQVAGPLESENSMEYTFAAPGDFSAVMTHELAAMTLHPDDADQGNDTTVVEVINTLCQPELICTYGVGIFELQLASIDNLSGCDPMGYGNYSFLMADLEQGSENDLTITTEYGDVYVKTWIDFNDNFMFEDDEIVVNDYVIAEGQTSGNYTETMPLVIPDDANLGEHLMRVKTNYNESVPNNPCEETLFGETEDYTANIDDATGLSIQSIETNELLVYNAGNNQFKVSYESVSISETLVISVHNLQGQTLVSNRVHSVNGVYLFDFDMSYAPRGIYLLRLGSKTFGKVKRFVVE